jgi:hypothetical protein
MSETPKTLRKTLEYLRQRLQDPDKPYTICETWEFLKPTIKSVTDTMDNVCHNPQDIRKQLNTASYHLEICKRCTLRTNLNSQPPPYPPPPPYQNNTSTEINETSDTEEPIVLTIKKTRRHKCDICKITLNSDLMHHLTNVHNYSDEVATELKTTHPDMFKTRIIQTSRRKRKPTFALPQEPLTKIHATESKYPILIQTPSHLCSTCNNLPPSDDKIHHLLSEHPEFFINKKLHKLMNTSNTIPYDQPIRNPPKHYPTNTNTMCALCLTTLETPQELYKHVTNNHPNILQHFEPLVTIHHNCRLHKCSLCNQSYYWSNNLRLHIQTSHKIGRTAKQLWQFPCPLLTNTMKCPIFTLKIGDLARHIKNFHNQETTLKNLTNHTTQTPIIPFYKCNICICSFFTHYDLSSHIGISHSPQTVNIDSNRKRLLNVSPFRCNACCTEKFLDINTLIQHQNKQQQTPNRI